MSTQTPDAIRALFTWVVAHPKRILILGLVLMLAIGRFLPTLEKDTRADAFLADDNPALVYKEKVREIFGLSDPMVVAVVAEGTIFTPDGLSAIRRISDALGRVDNIDPDGITSLATENNIVGTSDGMDVAPFYEAGAITPSQAEDVRAAIRDFPLYQGTLVANDESASLVVAELLDGSQTEATYQAILETLDALELPASVRIYVAGEGAISGYLGSYIDSDASRLNPIAALIITFIVFIAFQRFAPTLLANVIILAAALLTFGTMAATGVSFFVITNALPVILIGIAVADSIHIYSEYFERRAAYPEEGIADAIVTSMVSMWRPVTLTTLTTAAGFLGLYFAAYMPPFKYFGLFTALGVASAWLYSLIFLPAAMALFKTDVHPRLAARLTGRQPLLGEGRKQDYFARTMVLLGRLTMRFPKSIVVLALIIVSLGLVSAPQLIVNDDRIDSFHPDEPLYQADAVINGRFDGTNYLDVVIETERIEGIFEPDVLKRIEALQRYAETLPHVQGSVSIVDYLKQMNRALNEGQKAFYRLPDDADLIAQYFLLYSTSGEPTDFEEEVDYDYRLANVRLFINEGAFVDNQHVVLAMEDYIADHFNGTSVSATLSGRVNLTYHWIRDLGRSHFFGMGIALFLVWLVSSILFRSLVAGSFALIPVATSILLVYTAMVVLEIGLGIGTSMFAAVAIGLGVDFAIHTIDRIRVFYRQSDSIRAALDLFYPATGRALFFNLLAIGFGFGVLISSKVVPLNNFGTIVALSVTTSFLISMTLLPALILLFRPRFITGKLTKQNVSRDTAVSPGSFTLIIALLALAMFVSPQLIAAELPEGKWVAEQINQVDEGEVRYSKVTMTLTDKRGKERVREAVIYRKYYGEEKRTVLFYLSPRNVRDTAFLTYDYPDSDVDDDQWLYLPALRKSRRISASDRGDYFLGTDLSYEDMKKEGKFDLEDYDFEALRYEPLEGQTRLVLESIPKDDETARELGYGKVRAWVNPENWVIMQARYWDTNLNLLKTLTLDDVRQVDGIWTRHTLQIENHKTGHITHWRIADVDYVSDIGDSLFSRNALKRGAP